LIGHAHGFHEIIGEKLSHRMHISKIELGRRQCTLR